MPQPETNLYSRDSNVFEIIPSDTVPLRVPVDAFWVGTAGSLVIKNSQNETVTLLDVKGFIRLPGIAYVMAASTATGIVGIASRALR